LDPAGNSLDERKKPFVVLISGKEWWMRTEGVKPRQIAAGSAELEKLGIRIASGQKVFVGPDGAISATECGSSGDDLYVKEVSPALDPSPNLTAKPGAKARKYAPEAIEVFSNRNVPTFRNDLCFPLWLAFCSASYLHEGEAYSQPLIWNEFVAPEGSGKEFRILSKLKKQTGLSFPDEVRFENRGYSGIYDEASHSYVIQQLSAVQSYIEARYHVSDWEDGAGIVYPKKSSLEIYPIAKAGQNALEIPPAVRVLISVISLKTISTGIPVIRPTDLARVTDHRIPTAAGPLTYLTSNAFMAPGSEIAAKLVAARERRAEDLKLRGRQTSFRSFSRPFFLAILLLGLILPLAFLFKFRNKNTSNNKN